MIVDVHAHYIPKNYSELMGDRFPPRVGVPEKKGIARHPVSDSATDITGRLELMDAAGVEKQVLSPHRAPYLADRAECVKAVGMLNDGYADLAHRYPQRIASYVMLPLPHIDAALREMERGLDQLGCVGVNMHISCLNRSVAETEFEPIYEEMNRRGAILFVHPSVTGICSPFITDYGYTASVGTSLEDATFVLHMIAKQIPHRYPKIRFIVPHLGGPIPMLLNRLDQQGQSPSGHPEPRRGAERHRQTVLVRHRVLRLESGLHLRPRSLWRRPSGDRQRLSGVAGLRSLHGDLRLYQPARPTRGRRSTGSCIITPTSCSALPINPEPGVGR